MNTTLTVIRQRAPWDPGRHTDEINVEDLRWHFTSEADVQAAVVVDIHDDGGWELRLHLSEYTEWLDYRAAEMVYLDSRKRNLEWVLHEAPHQFEVWQPNALRVRREVLSAQLAAVRAQIQTLTPRTVQECWWDDPHATIAWGETGGLAAAQLALSQLLPTLRLIRRVE